MRVTLGDGRVVECAGGVTKLPPGPMPERLASEVIVPLGRFRSVTRPDGSMRDPNEVVTGQRPPTTGTGDGGGGGGSAPGAVPVMLHAEDPGGVQGRKVPPPRSRKPTVRRTTG